MQEHADVTRTMMMELPADDFFAMGQATENRVLQNTIEVGVPGIRIAAPADLDVTQVTELPVLYLRHTTGLRDWQVEFERNSQLVAVDLLHGQVRSGWAFPTHKRFSLDQLGKSLSGSAPVGAAASSTNTELYRIDARDVLKLDWTAGVWAITVLNYDWRSNTTVTHLTQAGAPDRPQSGIIAVDTLTLMDTADRRGAAAFRRNSQSPVVDGHGVNLSVPVSVDAAANAIPVLGTLRVPVPASAIVERLASDAAEESPAAQLAVTLLVVKRDELRASSVDVLVPAYSAEPVQAGNVLEAWFAIDLAKEGLVPLLADGESQLYLVTGQYVGGPWTINAGR